MNKRLTFTLDDATVARLRRLAGHGNQSRFVRYAVNFIDKLSSQAKEGYTELFVRNPASGSVQLFNGSTFDSDPEPFAVNWLRQHISKKREALIPGDAYTIYTLDEFEKLLPELDAAIKTQEAVERGG